jgi:hypothetical protein
VFVSHASKVSRDKRTSASLEFITMGETLKETQVIVGPKILPMPALHFFALGQPTFN